MLTKWDNRKIWTLQLKKTSLSLKISNLPPFDNFMFGFEIHFTQTRCLSVLDFWNINLGVYYKLEKNRFRNKLNFLSSLNLIFAGYTGSKNQVRTRQKIKFVSKAIFFRVWNWKKIEWHPIFQESSGDRQGDRLKCENEVLDKVKNYVKQ